MIPKDRAKLSPMNDYRDSFYARYHLTNGLPDRPDPAQYQAQARAFTGRWSKWLPANRRAFCLDLGCGAGEFLYFLKGRGYENIQGVDLNEQALELGKQMGLNTLQRLSAAEFLVGQSAVYDLITAFNFFEHLRKDEILHLLDLIYTALKPGGRMLAVTPNGISPMGGATRYWDFSHETGFTPASWRQLARFVGFTEPIFEEWGPLRHSFIGWVRSILWRIICLGISIYDRVEVGSPRDRSRVYTADMKIILGKP